MALWHYKFLLGKIFMLSHSLKDQHVDNLHTYLYLHQVQTVIFVQD